MGFMAMSITVPAYWVASVCLIEAYTCRINIKVEVITLCGLTYGFVHWNQIRTILTPQCLWKPLQNLTCMYQIW